VNPVFVNQYQAVGEHRRGVGGHEGRSAGRRLQRSKSKNCMPIMLDDPGDGGVTKMAKTIE